MVKDMEKRKNQHLKYALQFHAQENPDWDRVSLPITSFPEINLADVDTATDLMGFRLAHPFFINAMTGGSLRAEQLNQDLAILARECNLMLATGSYSIALKDPSARKSFTVIRRNAPNILLGVNLGADKNPAQVLQALEEMEADFLQIHVNSLQEMIMPEGEKNFAGWLDNIGQICQRVKVPVMVKQVGFGMSVQDIEKLIGLGVKTIDISGRGGTNFARIENARRKKEWKYLQDLGISTVDSLLNSQAYQAKADFIGSGGVKNPLHIAKALSLGAKAVGLAGQILYLLEREGLKATIEIMGQWQEELKLIYLACGAKDSQAMGRHLTKA